MRPPSLGKTGAIEFVFGPGVYEYKPSKKEDTYMYRWSWLAVVMMAVALPALAQDRWRDWERERGRDFREQVVSIEKRRMQWKLERMDRRLGELIARARPPDR
ncbi:MAG TPA: hypothetical protein VFB81_22210, partial [Myxococcales bacterium]|nr:hypothetical protein [Myxococcales bacterium]